MNLFSFIVRVVLVTTVFGRNIVDFWSELEMVTNARSREGKCGIRPLDDFNRHDLNENRIVNGEYASYGEFPWHVSLDRNRNGTRYQHCGASIINKFWLVTAAHCVETFPISDFYVTAGNYHWANQDEYEQSFLLEKIVIHEQYIGIDKGADHDIALLKIRSFDGRGIQFNKYVQPACLPDSSTSPKEGTKCLISGWGTTKNPWYDTNPGLLKKAELTVISKQTCKQIYTNGITDRMLCANDPHYHDFVCTGDSGGGLVSKRKGAYTLVGATSFGSEFCNTTSVFANVANLLPWIQSKLQEYSYNLKESLLPRRP